MSVSTDIILTELLDRAASETFGLRIATNNAKALQVNLCNVQRAIKRRDVIVCLPAEPDVVFLTKRSVELS